MGHVSDRNVTMFDVTETHKDDTHDTNSPGASVSN